MSSNETKQYDQTRLLWQCRRGMLELDLMLIPFAQEKYPDLPNDIQENFKALLHLPDPVVFAWLMGHESPTEPELIHVIQLIRDHYIPQTF